MSDPPLEARAPQDQERVRSSYDAVVDAYVERVHDELDSKPLDRGLLTAFAEQVQAESGAHATACDMGCGPGHVGAFLAERGLSITGIDLSPAMVDRARALHPGMTFEVGTITALDVPSGRFNGIVAFYSIIHLTTDVEVRTALGEFHRVLATGGLLLVAVHLGEHGDATVHADDMLGVTVDMDFRFFDAAGLENEINASGFVVEARLLRAPYKDVEVQTRRAYFLARRAEEANADET